MKTKTLVIIVSIQVVILLVLSGFLIYPYLPKEESYEYVQTGPNVVEMEYTFEELYSEKIKAYNGAIKNVGPVHDKESAKKKALEIWAELYSDEIILTNSVSVKYYGTQQCWYVSGMDNSRTVNVIEKDKYIIQQVVPAKYFYALITKDGEVLAVYER